MNALALSNTKAEKRLKSMKMPIGSLDERRDCLGERQSPLNAVSQNIASSIPETGTVEM